MKYYRLTINGKGFFTTVNEVLDYYDDLEYYEDEENLNRFTAELEVATLRPRFENKEGIFAYKETWFEKINPWCHNKTNGEIVKEIYNMFERNENEVGYYEFNISEVFPTKILWEDEDQIAYI